MVASLIETTNLFCIYGCQLNAFWLMMNSILLIGTIFCQLFYILVEMCHKIDTYQVGIKNVLHNRIQLIQCQLDNLREFRNKIINKIISMFVVNAIVNHYEYLQLENLYDVLARFITG